RWCGECWRKPPPDCQALPSGARLLLLLLLGLLLFSLGFLTLFLVGFGFGDSSSFRGGRGSLLSNRSSLLGRDFLSFLRFLLALADAFRLLARFSHAAAGQLRLQLRLRHSRSPAH